MKVNTATIELCKYDALLHKLSELEHINEKQEEKLNAIDNLISDVIEKCIKDETKTFSYECVCMDDLFDALAYSIKAVNKKISEERKMPKDETGGYAE